MLINGTSTNEFFSKNLKKRNPSVTTKTYEEDLKFGFKNEKDIIPILNNFFNDTFTNTTRYCNYDFLGIYGKRIELKTRRNKYSDYPTTIIPIHKCITMDLCPNLFVFKFTDGIYYIEWNKNKFETYEKKIIQYNRLGRTDKNEYYLIPIQDLQIIN
jgi:hypothetical protein